MRNKLLIVFSFCLISSQTLSVLADEMLERDPFSPFVLDIPTGVAEVPVDVESEDDVEVFVNPLERNSIYTYKVTGIMTSPDKAIAVVKTIERQEFFVRRGDKLGKEGGVIDVINIEGISVVNDEEVIDIPVRNKVEIQPTVGVGGGLGQEE